MPNNPTIPLLWFFGAIVFAFANEIPLAGLFVCIGIVYLTNPFHDTPRHIQKQRKKEAANPK